MFLSYASQDAEAVQRLADALRTAGVEVWFDRNELVGGDAWDAKIRNQIKTCALFVPVISRATQTRREGYFRIEWKLAAQRTQAIADGTPFLVPVVIDTTRDESALVPEEFRAVQWTRLPGGETPPSFCDRVKKLLEPPPSATTAPFVSVPRPARDVGKAVPHSSAPSRRSAVLRWAIGAAGVAVLGLGGYFALRSTPQPTAHSPTLTKPEAAKPALVSAPAPTEAAQLVLKAYAVTQKLGFTREELAAADTYVQRATSLEPDSARAWAVLAWVRGCYLMRNWDVSTRRLQQVQTDANHALALDGNDPDALNALASVFEKQRSPAEAEKVCRQAIAASADNSRSWLLLGRALRVQNKKAESMEIMHEAVRRFPKNALCRYELANNYVGLGTLLEPVAPANLVLGVQQLDAAIAEQPFASALVYRAVWEAAGPGDLVRMRTFLDRLETMPMSDRTEDRVVFVSMLGGLLERKPERVLAAAKVTSRLYFEDSVVDGPKGWSTGLAYRLAGKEALARQEWLEAEAVQRKRLIDQPNAVESLFLAITLAWLGKDQEADQVFAPIESAWREELNHWNSRQLARYYAARGDARRAVPYLRESLNYNSFLTDALLMLDPWWDKLRGQPEFETLLAEAQARRSASNP